MSFRRLAFTLAFWSFFLVTALFGFGLALLVAAAALPFDPDRRVAHAFICRWTHGYLHLVPGWRVEVLHRERLPPGPSVIVANHQSMADIIVAMGLRHPFKFVAKESLYGVPLVGWAMWLARYVRVERGRARSMRRMMDTCRRWLRRGMAVLLFPEGTYGPGGPGARLLPFKRGAFQLAVEERVPVVPLAIEGTPGLVHGDGPLLSPTARVRMTVLPPVTVGDLGEDPAALAARVRASLEDALGLPRSTASPPDAD